MSLCTCGYERERKQIIEMQRRQRVPLGDEKGMGRVCEAASEVLDA